MEVILATGISDTTCYTKFSNYYKFRSSVQEKHQQIMT